MTTSDKVREIICWQFHLDKEDVTLDLNFEKDLGADSLDAVEIIMMVEDEFDTGHIEDSDVEKIKTVRDLVKIVEKYIGGI